GGSPFNPGPVFSGRGCAARSMLLVCPITPASRARRGPRHRGLGVYLEPLGRHLKRKDFPPSVCQRSRNSLPRARFDEKKHAASTPGPTDFGSATAVA